MHLKNIKLSGFKSFVDPTTIPFEQKLTAVVGPNGCGKSNIVDAIRWVMGESSVKTLRGESMADVIFNGSTARKPVGQALVQLTLDNTDSTIGGEYAQYNEVAIKRVASRDGTSNYFLNNIKCRRKDITDIFLGTGLGPRSYTVIEQGMISRFIEAKPDDLRIYLEEAAGISKYKERRRETENRIHHARENLDRIADLREETNTQFEKLQRQAKTANRYKVLKQDERLIQAQLHALHWQVLEQQMQNFQRAITVIEVDIEQQLAQQQQYGSEIETLRAVRSEASDAFNTVQGCYYGLGAEIAKIEQNINHCRTRYQQLQQDQVHIEQSNQEISQNRRADQCHLKELQEELDLLMPQFDNTKTTAEQSRALLLAAEEEMANWQVQRDGFVAAAAQASQTMEVEQTRVQHAKQIIKVATARIEKFSAEASTIDNKELSKSVQKLAVQSQQAEMELAEQEQEVAVVTAEIQQLHVASETTARKLDKVKESLQQVKGRRESLLALQQAALGIENEVVIAWLEENKLQQKPRLAQRLQVDSGWEKAVETVLSVHLQAICVDNYHMAEKLLQRVPAVDLEFFIDNDDVNVGTNGDLLSSKVRGSENVVRLLANIYYADSLATAKKILTKLEQHQSVITRDGFWLSQQWLRVAADKNDKTGILQRKNQLQQLDKEIQMLDARLAMLQAQLQRQKQQLSIAEQRKETLQRQYHIALQNAVELSAEQQFRQQQMQQIQQRQQQLTRELSEQQQLLQQQQQLLTQSQDKLQQASSRSENYTQQKDQLQTAGERYRHRLQQLRIQAQQHADTQHRLEVRIEQLKPQIATLIASIERGEKQLQTLFARSATLSQSLDAEEKPIAKLQTELEQTLAQRVTMEGELTNARLKIEKVTQQIVELEESKENVVQKVEEMRRNLQEQKLQQRTSEVRKRMHEEQLAELDYTLNEVLHDLPEADISTCEQAAQRITERISRLGAVNLAAIDECKVQEERKQYLDKQYEDLIEALTTLEKAIDKIDKETGSSFKETFDKVNDGFKSLFPHVFGGGSAYLKLTGDDLLDTGVSVMARPPGKRNTSIQLLSGGEKALTAISLVFAIFHLQPAPFCLLDEVDAPLDDVNIGRFCALVKGMSKKVQFLFISHNKLAIEMAEQLTGIIMHEPGVSRVVTVDVEKAVELAAT